MHDAYIPIKLKYRFFKEAFNTATFMDGLDVININGKNIYYIQAYLCNKLCQCKSLKNMRRIWNYKVSILRSEVYDGWICDQS